MVSYSMQHFITLLVEWIQRTPLERQSYQYKCKLDFLGQKAKNNEKFSRVTDDN